MKIKSVSQTDISNDGKYVAYVVRGNYGRKKIRVFKSNLGK